MTTLTFPFLAASARRLGTLAAPSLGIAVKDVRIGWVRVVCALHFAN